MFALTGKTAVVTGGSSGIGEAIAHRFRAAGANVLIADRKVPRGNFAFHETDVSSEDALTHALETARRDFGTLDILVSNAGIQPLGVGFADLSTQLFDRTFAVNVRSVAFGIKLAGQLLSDGGRVINLGSFVGMIGVPRAAVYAASKAAVIHLTKLGALELAARRITVNTVSPGTIRTPAVTSIPNNPEIPFMEARTPLKRLGEPAEVAALCQFLATDEAGYITGQNIAIDGGLTAGWNQYDLVPPPNLQDERWIDDI